MALNMSGITKYVDKVVDQKLVFLANGLSDKMRDEVNFDTGLLQASVTKEKIGNKIYKIGHRPGLLIARSGEDYAKYVFYGSVKIEPNNWIAKTMSILPSLLARSTRI